GRGEGAKKTWMERVIGGIEKRVLALYGGSLWWFLRWRWVSLVIWVVCLAGTIWFFILIPKAFLPPGDSSVIFGAFIAREGSSPDRSEEHTSELQSPCNLVCRLLLEKKKNAISLRNLHCFFLFSAASRPHTASPLPRSTT